MAETTQILIVGHLDEATPLTYRLYITDQTLPTIDTAWVKVELGAGVYAFRRSADITKTFDISGYISEESMAATRTAAESLNEELIDNPSGRLIDGFGVVRDVIVNSWNIKPVAAQNKYTFNMSLTMMEF